MRPIDANALKFPSMEGKFCEVDLARIDGYHKAIEVIRRAPTLSLNTLRDEIYQDAVAHGLWEDYYIGLSGDLLDECHDLIYDEVDELDDSIKDWINLGNHNRFAEELADVIIMCFSVAGKLGIDIDAAIRRKMEINKGRPCKHGKDR